MKESLALKKLNITHDKSDNAVVMADANLTKTIIRNLVANAIKYTPKQGSIHIETYSIHGEVQMVITDTGQGIPEEIQNQLFTDSVASQRGTQGELGNGLGLSLCGDFARKQKGTLSLDKDFKSGAKLILTLPSGD
jgi:signal transduction histidine kinase